MSILIASPASAPKWNLIETLSPSAAATVTCAALPTGYKRYRVEWELVSASGGGTINLQFNGDTGGNYAFRTITTTAASNNTAQTSISLGAKSTANRSAGSFETPPTTPTIAAGEVGFLINGQTGGTTILAGSVGIYGVWAGGSAVSISTMTFAASTGSITGEIRIYGVLEE